MEKRETSLQKMLATVLNDKQKIEDTIDELDQYKRDALLKTWEKVNGYDFDYALPPSLNQFVSVISVVFSQSFCRETLRNFNLQKDRISWTV